MSELKARTVYVDCLGKTIVYYDPYEVKEAIKDLEESHKKEVSQLLMKITGLEKLVETADKILKEKGGFTVKDITFKGIKVE